MSGAKIALVIDEEPHFSDIMASALRIKGFKVEQFYDATGAWNSICCDVTRYRDALMFIDMALEPGEDRTSFSMENTDRYHTTGLVLAKLILDDGIVQSQHSKNIVLYSAHLTNQVWSKIEAFSETRGTRKWRKRADADLAEIFLLADGKSINTY